jgi:acyl-CoA synthetase (AMP-forming)/AMP-acid ligase II
MFVYDVTLKEIQDWCSRRLAKYKIPTKLLLLDEIPKVGAIFFSLAFLLQDFGLNTHSPLSFSKNAMGKVNKKELVKLFDESRDRPHAS